MKRVLTIAGSDSGGGAGIQADLATFRAFGCHGLTAVTAVTAQDSVRVHRWWPVPADVVRAQVRAVVDDIGVDAVKVGMLGTAEVAAAVADELATVDAPIVVDPVCAATSGDALLAPDALDVLRGRVIPLATVVTPNRDEARLLGDLNVPYVVVTGSDDAVDVVLHDGDETVLTGTPVDTPHTHGSGCTFASAIAARLAYGDDVLDAVRAAKEYVAKAIAGGYPLGSGRGPVLH